MGKFSGLRFLELGTSIGSVDIVNYAKKEGAYVIVTDYLPTEKSAAKMLADQVFSVSVMDEDAVYALAKEQQVDGIFCGASEDILKVVMSVTSRLGLPCYLTPEQFRLNNDKNYFKEIVSKYGMAIPRKYDIEDFSETDTPDGSDYPFVVKPNDMGAGIGVKICDNYEILREEYYRAKELSPSHCAFIEDYIVGDETTVAYTIKNGYVSLSMLKDRYLSEDHKNITALQDLIVTPSKYIDEYVETEDKKVRNFLASELYGNGPLVIQGIYRNHKMYYLEMATRIPGSADYKIIREEKGIDYTEMLTSFALTGGPGDLDITRDSPDFSSLYGIFYIFAHAGVIGKLDGLDKISAIPGVYNASFSKSVGNQIYDDGTLRQEVFRAYIKVPGREALAESIKQIQANIIVEDEHGNNMLFKKFDVNRLQK